MSWPWRWSAPPTTPCGSWGFCSLSWRCITPQSSCEAVIFRLHPYGGGAGFFGICQWLVCLRRRACFLSAFAMPRLLGGEFRRRGGEPLFLWHLPRRGWFCLRRVTFVAKQKSPKVGLGALPLKTPVGYWLPWVRPLGFRTCGPLQRIGLAQRMTPPVGLL